MTRKDYELLSKVFRERVIQEDLTAQEICYTIAEALHEDNPAFDTRLFLKNCGVSVINLN